MSHSIRQAIYSSECYIINVKMHYLENYITKTYFDQNLLTSEIVAPLPVYLHIATWAFSSAFDLLHCNTSFYDFGKPMDSYHI